MGGVPAQLGGDEVIGTRARGDRENLLGGQRGEELASVIGGKKHGSALRGPPREKHRSSWLRCGGEVERLGRRLEAVS